jgi:hypothetical protein
MRRDENGAYEICEYKLENGMCTYTQEEYIKNLEYFGNPPITIDKFGMALPVWNVGR